MTSLSRRRFLTGGAVAGAALAAGGVAGAAQAQPSTSASSDPAGAQGPDGVGVAPLYGPHQANVLRNPTRSTILTSFDVIAGSRAELADLLATVSQRVKVLWGGEALAPSEPDAPPADNGVLGPTVAAGQLGVVLGLGASLFDDRYGLAARKPAGLVPMKTFPNDHLDPALTHGDLTLQLTADSPDIVVHALRDLTKHTRGAMQPRWRVDGFASPPRPSGAPRNLFGFNDGISNPDVDEQQTLDRLVWVDKSQPAWTHGGTFLVVRIIRQLVEFWDRVSLQEQELMIGRRRASGAPLDADRASAIPDYAADPHGQVIPLDAHIRMANPRTPETEDSRILRRAWNYDLGLDVNGNLNQGLLFVCYQQDTHRQFEATQTRLINEPMVDYVTPVGGGYFFVPPGLADRSDTYARGLFA